MSKKYNSLIFLLAACVLLSLLYCPPWDVFFDDKEIFRYTGMVIQRGGVPYRDFFDHKPPLIFFMNYAGLLLGPWGLWLIDAVLVLLATLLFFDLGKKYKLPHPWFPPLLFNLICRHYIICKGIGMTREYTAIFLLISFCLILGKYRYRFLLLGALCALTFFMQQDQVFPLLPFLLYALVMEDNLSIFKRLIWLGAGFMVITAPLLIYFGLNHSLSIFWQDAFLFNMDWYTRGKKSLLVHFRDVKTAMDGANLEIAFLIPATLGMASLFMLNRRKGLTVIALAALILSFVPEYMTGNLPDPNVYYYFLPLASTLSILLFIVFAFTEENLIRDKMAQRIFGFILCCSLGYGVLQHATHLHRYPADYVRDEPALKYLEQHPPGDYKLYVFGTSTLIYAYNKFQILAPSHWIYQDFWFRYERWDPDQILLKSIGKDLLRHHTTYIMNFSYASKFRNPANYLWWKSFLQQNYEPVTLPDPTAKVLWKIKDSLPTQDPEVW